MVDNRVCLLYSSGNIELHCSLSSWCEKYGYKLIYAFNFAEFMSKYYCNKPKFLMVDAKVPGSKNYCVDFIKSITGVCPKLFLITDSASEIGYAGDNIYTIQTKDIKDVFNIQNEYNNEEKQLSSYVTTYLKSLGLNDKYVGFRYLLSLILDIRKDKSSFNSFSTKLYPLVAKEYGTNPSSVERDIRFMIKHARQTDKFKSMVGTSSNRAVVGAILSDLDIFSL